MAVCNLACEGLSGASTTHDLAQRKLYIGGLSPDITSEKLLDFFGKYGDIEEGSVAYDKDTNESRYNTMAVSSFVGNSFISQFLRCLMMQPSLSIFLRSGFGFVTYKTVDASKRAIDDPNKMLGVSNYKPCD